MADILGTLPLLLALDSIEWRWLKPANSPWLPLRSASGYSSLIKQLALSTGKAPNAYIIVQMDEPLRQQLNPEMVCSLVQLLILSTEYEALHR